MLRNKLTILLISFNIIFLVSTTYLLFKLYSEKRPNLSNTKEIREALFNDSDSFSTLYYHASEFSILGKLSKAKNYTRLPDKSKKTVIKSVWELSKNSAGISVRFSSNSSKIKIRWSLPKDTRPSNMTDIASHGLDLYAYVEDRWQFVGAAVPDRNIENEYTVIFDMDTINREFLLNLPLFSSVESLQIGVDKNSSISKPKTNIINTNHPIIFYGTSITQGASASRPGLIYTSLLERHFNREVINLGFSGNGRFHKSVGECFMEENPSLIVLDCTPNCYPDTIRKNLPELISYIRSLNTKIPVVLIESITRDFAFFKKDDKSKFGTLSFIQNQNKTLYEIYLNESKKHSQIYYINASDLIGNDHEATIDGTHFNDLGHFRTFQKLKNELSQIMQRQ